MTTRTTTRAVAASETLKTGDRLTLDLVYREGAGWEVARTGQRVTFQGTYPTRRGDDLRIRSAGTITREVPTLDFEPGDVVVIQFDPNGTEYTYVRGTSRFCGEGSITPPSDKSVRDLFAQGRVRLIARQGRAFTDPITVHNVLSRLGAGLPF